MSQFNLTELTNGLLKNVSTLVEEVDTLKKDVEFLTKENRLLKEQLAFEQRQNQRHANKRG